MVNFRYHIVSLVAVFLALAIGVIMGSTVIDRVTVETLERQQARLDGNLTKARAENNKLSGDLDDLRQLSHQLTKEIGERLSPGALRDVPVLLIGLRGSEPAGQKELITALTQANARVQPTMWLTERFKLAKSDDQKALAGLLEVEEKSATRLRRLGLERIGAVLRLLAIGESTPDSGLLGSLSNAGFIEFDGGDTDVPAAILPGTRVLLMAVPEDQADGEPNAPVTAANKVIEETLGALTRSLVGGLEAATDLLVAESAVTDQIERARLVEPLRDDKALVGRFSSVDNLDEPIGRMAILLALHDLGVDGTGHYGSGPGATRLLPALPPPAPGI